MREEMNSTTIVFRQLLSSVKKRIIESNTYESQNPKAIYEVQKILKEMYYAIRKVIEKREPFSVLKPYSLDILFEDVLDKDLTEDERDELMYYARRDLLTFPFTLDIFHTNSNLVKKEDKE